MEEKGYKYRRALDTQHVKSKLFLENLKQKFIKHANLYIIRYLGVGFVRRDGLAAHLRSMIVAGGRT